MPICLLKIKSQKPKEKNKFYFPTTEEYCITAFFMFYNIIIFSNNTGSPRNFSCILPQVFASRRHLYAPRQVVAFPLVPAPPASFASFRDQQTPKKEFF
jgi:hypothetical protein